MRKQHETLPGVVSGFFENEPTGPRTNGFPESLRAPARLTSPPRLIPPAGDDAQPVYGHASCEVVGCLSGQGEEY